MNAFLVTTSLAAVIALALPTASAVACSLVPYRASNYRIDTQAIPTMMVSAATTVDLVVAETVDRSAMDKRFNTDMANELADAATEEERAEIRSDYEDIRDQWRRSGAGAVTYRVVERLKGDSLDTFVMNAFVPLEGQDKWEPELKWRVAKRGDFRDAKATWAMSTKDIAEWGGLGSCSSPLFATIGAYFLVFRGADGRLLENGVQLERRFDGRFQPSTRDGPVYEPVLLEDDPWLNAVRAAAGKP
jgi:hypothetical protein